jgi:dipeptidyl aminopeptidase/acylaminoacyl peptidase
MTTFERFERDIPELMTDLAPARVPDYFDSMLRETARHRQRPAWSYLERWLPMGVLARTAPVRPFSWRPILILALIGALIAAGFALYVGSRQAPLPPPFGVAGNGVLMFRDLDGSVRSIDPSTMTQATIAAASDGLGDPVPSRNGRRIAFVPSSVNASSIIISGIDGSQRSVLGGEYRDIEMVDWSPDDAHIAIVANNDGLKAITIAATDGSSAKTLSLERDVWKSRYLPDGRLAFIAAEQPGQLCPASDPTSAPCALFVVNPDGTGLKRLQSAADFQGLGVDPSADGTKLVYVEWASGAPGRLHVVDLGSGGDRLLPVEGFPAEYNINRAWFSPDGTSILFDLFEAEGDHWAVVPADGGPFVRIGPEWPGDTPEASWAPDGRSVLARYPTSSPASELWFLDATGNGVDQRLEVDIPSMPAWQRVATQRGT